MTDEIPQSIWQGTFTILGVEMKCHVLSDGRRIIEKASVEAFVEALGSDRQFSKDEGAELGRFFMWQKGRGL